MTPGRLRSVLAGGVVVVGAVVVLAGCGSDGSTPPPSSSPTASTSSPAPSSTAPVTTTPPATPTSSTPAPPSSTAPTTPTGSATPPGLAACDRLDVAVTRVPGAAGVNYALVSVTNRGSARCGLPAIPVLRLLGADRAALTPPASAAGSGNGADLDPGAVASTLLADRSDTCSTNTRSTYLEVTATSSSGTVVQPLALPPCTLSVKPFTPGTEPTP